MIEQSIFLIISLVVLYFGAEFTLNAAEKIGFKLGLSPLVVGMILIGFGTSLPELFVSQLASYRGVGELALGNIIGSNVANFFLVLAIAAIFTPLTVAEKHIVKQMKWHMSLYPLLGIVVYLGKVSYVSGALLLAFFLLFFKSSWDQNKNDPKEFESLDDIGKATPVTYILFLVGLVLLYFGGELLVGAGSKLGEMLGISTYVISAVFVAFGTSFPELVTAILACLKKKDTELILGNILGSNIFNVSLVMGSLFPYGVEIKSTFHVEIFSLVLGSAVLMILAQQKAHMGRLLGFVFISVYVGIIFYWI